MSTQVCGDQRVHNDRACSAWKAQVHTFPNPNVFPLVVASSPNLLPGTAAPNQSTEQQTPTRMAVVALIGERKSGHRQGAICF